ncbi:MAG: M20/M25/M40 family metallo-hydrolase [Coriobacteriales bacterium]|nr:M20/M25/M40 family metallo-hydrolase [Coriobacteriales bacterium]
MNAQRLLETFCDLVRISSPSKEEAEVAIWCAAALKEAGCTVRFDESAVTTGSDTGNLIAYLPPSPGVEETATLYFSAHMDTVNPGRGIEPIIGEDGIIRSTGETVLGGDDKSGIAPIIELVRTLAEGNRPHPRIGVLLSTCEEIGLLGAAAMDNAQFHDEPCFVLDAGGAPGYVIIGSPFHHTYKATFTGKASHAGILPEEGISAIMLAGKAIVAMEQGRLDAFTTANVGTIVGGLADNIVPETCMISGEFRAMEPARRDYVQAEMEARMREAAATGGGSVEIIWKAEYEGFTISEDDPLVRFVLDTARELGLPADAAFSGGGSDANFLNSRGLRPLVLGTGMTEVHSTREALAIRDLEDTCRLIEALAYNWQEQRMGL